jgi:hypothetical protein
MDLLCHTPEACGVGSEKRMLRVRPSKRQDRLHRIEQLKEVVQLCAPVVKHIDADDLPYMEFRGSWDIVKALCSLEKT